MDERDSPAAKHGLSHIWGACAEFTPPAVRQFVINGCGVIERLIVARTAMIASNVVFVHNRSVSVVNLVLRTSIVERLGIGKGIKEIEPVRKGPTQLYL